jgi:uncharacterized protein (DUF433 family)
MNTRIVSSPDVLMGLARFKDTNIAVERICREYSEGHTDSDILSKYPKLQQEDLTAAKEYIKNRERILGTKFLHTQGAQDCLCSDCHLTRNFVF